MQEAIEDAAAQDVPLSFIPCDSLLANTRMHHVGDSFLLHLERSVSAGGLIKGNPLQMLAQSNSMEEELESYLRTKMYNLQEAWAQSGTFSDERMASFLKKLLEAPMHVARKTLARHIPLGADSKAYVQTTYAENMPLSMVIQLQRLVSLDQEYTELLQKQSMFRNETEYRAFLQKILAHTEDVLAFIRSNLAHVAATAR